MVLAIEEDLGIDILHRCGGNAMCTTCRVQFEVGEPSRMTEAERERLTERDLLGQARFSCQILRGGDGGQAADDGVVQRDRQPGARPADEITPEPRWTDL